MEQINMLSAITRHINGILVTCLPIFMHVIIRAYLLYTYTCRIGALYYSWWDPQHNIKGVLHPYPGVAETLVTNVLH